ncbi:MFS transporter [Clostridium sp.]|uniref:MFS transporter n=1 Tax=Clostridium sp. TaxID=1506 RepID=UPI002FC80DC9
MIERENDEKKLQKEAQGNNIENSDLNKSERLWNKNFFLLWQGQLVSVLGNIVYSIALGFWILDLTGSTALMGSLMATSMVPNLILTPFAGVLVDKWDRKWVIVITDFIRGVFNTLIGVAALLNFIEIWMVFGTALINGLCAAFFNPAISSVQPDIVPKSKLLKANSISTMSSTSMQMIGNAIGGGLYIVFGAAYMFLFNGISFLFSAFTEIFIVVPPIEKSDKKVTFLEDFKEGFKFTWNFKALRRITLTACFINFVANGAFLLVLPYFKSMEFLGPTKYGYAIALESLGMVAGSLLLSVVTIPCRKKFNVFIIGSILLCICPILFLFSNNFYIITGLFFLQGLGNAIINTLLSATMQMIVPREMRGKVFALFQSLVMGLSPLGTLLGGILGEVLPLKIVMGGGFIILLIEMIGFCMLKGCKEVINYDSENSSVEQLMANASI